MKYIVTHPGQAHRDDFLACAIWMAVHGKMQVIRREPTKEELEDAGIVVIDVGRRHEPHLNNFDHHQYKEGDAALTLVLKHLGLYEAMTKYCDWVEFSNAIDTKGPFRTAENLGLPPKTLTRLMSPIETSLLALFSEAGQPLDCLPSRYMEDLLYMIGLDIVGHVKDLQQRIEVDLPAHAFLEGAKGVGVLFSHIEDNPALGLSEYAAGIDGIGVTVCPDDRGPGWCLFRLRDNPRVDFTRIKDDPRVSFAHASGFIAKTKTRLSSIELTKLIGEAISD